MSTSNKDSRENPVMDRFPSVTGVGRCVEGPGRRCDSFAAHPRRFDDQHHAAAPLVAETIGWHEAPAAGGDASLDDSFGQFGTGPMPQATDLPTNRHSRGGVLTEGSERVREVGVGHAPPPRRMPNYETRMLGECSRQIAHEKSKQEHAEWEERVANQCSACTPVPQ